MLYLQAYVSHPSEVEYEQSVVQGGLGGGTATQTYDDNPVLVGNKPTNQNLAALYHGGWPIHKGMYKLTLLIYGIVS